MTKPKDGQVLHFQEGDDGVFFVQQGEERIAELTYKVNGDTAIVDHTWVDPKHRGSPLAPDLVEALVDWARREKHQVVPMCSYVRSVFQRTPAYADVHRATD